VPLTIDPTYDVEVHLVLHCLMNTTDKRNGANSNTVDTFITELGLSRDEVQDALQSLIDMGVIVYKEWRKKLVYIVLSDCGCSLQVVHDYALACRLLQQVSKDYTDTRVGEKSSRGQKPRPPKGSGPGGPHSMQHNHEYMQTEDDNVIVRGHFPPLSEGSDDDPYLPGAHHVDWCSPTPQGPLWKNTLVRGNSQENTCEFQRSGGAMSDTVCRISYEAEVFEKDVVEFDIQFPPSGATSSGAKEIVPPDRVAYTLEGESLPSVSKQRIIRRRGQKVDPDSAPGLAIYFKLEALKYDPLARTNCGALANNFKQDLEAKLEPEVIRKSINTFFTRKPRVTVNPLWQQYLRRRRALIEDASKSYFMNKYRYGGPWVTDPNKAPTEMDLNRYNKEYWIGSK
jgi:hypothetical protein